MEVGAAVVDITPPPGLRMAGYGARRGVAEGTLTPLKARILVLRADGRHAVLIVVDAVAVGRALTAAVRARLREQIRVSASEVMLAATHTHSAVSLVTGGDVPPWLDGSDEPGRIERVAAAVEEGVLRAAAAAQPARFTTAELTVPGVSRNRRDPDGPGGDRFRILVAERSVDRRPIAVLINGDVHPTVLEADNLLYSPDFPGAAATAVEEVTGAAGIFLTGTAGDVNPVWRTHTADEARRIGRIIGVAAAGAALRLQAAGDPHWVVNLSRADDLPVEGPDASVLSPLPPASAMATVELAEQAASPTQQSLSSRLRYVEERISELRRSDPHLLAVREELRIAHRLADCGQGPGGRSRRTQVQVLRLGSGCVLVALPGEFFVETRKILEDRLGVPHVIVAGYANDYVGYVPPAGEFARAGYEVGCARFAPDAESRIVDAAARLSAVVRRL